jgi:hypothetical protein
MTSPQIIRLNFNVLSQIASLVGLKEWKGLSLVYPEQMAEFITDKYIELQDRYDYTLSKIKLVSNNINKDDLSSELCADLLIKHDIKGYAECCNLMNYVQKNIKIYECESHAITDYSQEKLYCDERVCENCVKFINYICQNCEEKEQLAVCPQCATDDVKYCFKCFSQFDID